MVWYAFTLPGAEKFARFLDQRLPQMILTDGPEISFKDGKPYCRQWNVIYDGEVLGAYKTWPPRKGETEFFREYHGIIPGYVDVQKVSEGEFLPFELRKGPLNLVSLIWGDQICVVEEDFSGQTSLRVLQTPWQRQDRHHSIPFP